MNSQTAAILTLCAALLSSTLLVGLFFFPELGLKTRRFNRRALALLACLQAVIVIVYWLFNLSLATAVGPILGAFISGVLIAPGVLPLILWRRAPKLTSSEPANNEPQNESQEVIEELVMMQHVDRELSATLDFDAV